MKAPGIPGPFRSSLAALRPFDHGPTDEEAREFSGRRDIVNLASNENAYGPSPHVIEAVTAAAAKGWIYPDPRCAALRMEIAAGLEVSPDRLVFAAGAETLLEFITRATLSPGASVLISPPTFPIYGNNARVLDARIVSVPRRADFTIDRDAMIAAANDTVRIVFLCNPDNPTGTTGSQWPTSRRLPWPIGPNCLIVLDEAYQEFADHEHPRATIDALDQAGACYFILRTFSKAFALGGYRVGYGIAGTAETAQALDLVRTQFSVNTLAQTAAIAAWRDRTHLAAVINAIRAARDAMAAEIRGFAFTIPKSAANFIYLSLPRGSHALYTHLLRAGIITRPVADIGLRVTVGQPEQNERFLTALEPRFAA